MFAQTVVSYLGRVLALKFELERAKEHDMRASHAQRENAKRKAKATEERSLKPIKHACLASRPPKAAPPKHSNTTNAPQFHISPKTSGEAMKNGEAKKEMQRKEP